MICNKIKSYNLDNRDLNKIKVLSKSFFLMKSRTKDIISQFKLDNTFVYSWGMKKSGKSLRNKLKNKKKIVFIEDGFIH